MTKYNSFAELNADYAKRYGDDWENHGRSCLDTEEQQVWINACYDLYPKEYKLRSTFKAEDERAFEYPSCEYNGKRFKILRSVAFDIPCGATRPMYEIQFIDSGRHLFAFPEEIFDCD